MSQGAQAPTEKAHHAAISALVIVSSRQRQGKRLFDGVVAWAGVGNDGFERFLDRKWN